MRHINERGIEMVKSFERASPFCLTFALAELFPWAMVAPLAALETF